MVRRPGSWFLGILASTSITRGAAAQEPIIFPDARLEQCVKRELGLGANEAVTPALAAGASRLSCFTEGVTNLSGLEAFSSMEAFLAWDNDIVSLAPIAGLKGLRHLNLRGNRVSDLAPLAGLDELAKLVLSKNDVKNVTPLSALRKLRTLYLDGNPIGDAHPLSSLSQVIDLSLDDTQIGNLAPLAELTSLKRLWLRGLGLESAALVPLSQLVALEVLALSRNAIGDVTPLAVLPNLRALELSKNQIVEASALTRLPLLRELWLDENCIADFSAFSDHTELTLVGPGRQTPARCAIPRHSD